MNTEHVLHTLNFPSEGEIVEKIVNGEKTLFEVLIRRFNAVLYKIGRTHGFNHQDAEDLMQDTHMAAYHHLAQFEGRSSYKTWISRIMINKCLYKINYDHSKNEMHGNGSIPDNAIPIYSSSKQDGPETNLLKREFSSVLENALQKISLPHRTVFALRELEGFSVSETAELLGITPVNVKVRLNRAKAMLQKQLEEFYSGKDIYEFHLIYCDAIVKKVFQSIFDK
jgi:RNA polymerase sigma factor (sigma-70 family)